jgi:hypothetical protein
VCFTLLGIIFLYFELLAVHVDTAGENASFVTAIFCILYFASHGT